MSLPSTFHDAIDALAARSVRPSRAAPLWFRLYLRCQPHTPLPHFGASPGAWRFLALFNLFVLSAGALLLGALGGFDGVRDGADGHVGAMAMAAVIVAVCIAGASWASARATRSAYLRDAARLALPDWNAFEPRPDLAAEPGPGERTDTFWLRSLSAGLFSVTRPGPAPADQLRRGHTLVTLSAWVGVLGFAVFAWLWPAKAASYGDGMALVYVLVCGYGATQTARQRPSPGNPGPGRF